MPGQGEAGSAGAGPSGGTSGGQSGGGHRLGTAADAAPPTAAAPQVNEQAVSKLTELGFSREESIQALQACGGNADAAASMLFSGS